MINVPEFWTDESEPGQQIFYHPSGDQIFEVGEVFERRWDNGSVTKHATLEEAFNAEVPEGE